MAVPRTLAANRTLSPAVRQTVTSRLQALDARITVRDQQRLQTADAMAAGERMKALRAEHDELTERIKAHPVTSYAAVGVLRMSSLQQAGTTLYHLTDPTTFRTVVYIRTSDPKYTDLLEKFVGVRGPITGDATARHAVRRADPRSRWSTRPKVGNGITAAITPASMLARPTPPAAN